MLYFKCGKNTYNPHMHTHMHTKHMHSDFFYEVNKIDYCIGFPIVRR